MLIRRHFVNLALTSVAAGLPLRVQAQDTPALRVASTANDSYAWIQNNRDMSFMKTGNDFFVLTHTGRHVSPNGDGPVGLHNTLFHCLARCQQRSTS
jgi:hypothetical protein